MPHRVGLVIVSHSTEIARGVARLVAQTAPDVVVVAAGGASEDPEDLGTSFDRVSRALAEADGGAGAVVLTDLGSAVLTSESALELLDDAIRERIRIADAPLVEGAVAAGVAAQTGGRVDDVLAEAERAAGGRADGARESVARESGARESGARAVSSAPPGGSASASASGKPAGVRRTVEVRADQGAACPPGRRARAARRRVRRPG